MRRLIVLVSLLSALLGAAPALAAAGPEGASSSAPPAGNGAPVTPPTSAPITPPITPPITLPDGSLRAAGTPGLPSILSARAWLVADADTGAVLATRDPHAPMPPASTLKLLTALALQPVLPADGWAAPSAQAVGVTGSKAHVDQGARYRISDLFRMMLIISANDAAETLAQAAGGDARAVSLMTTEARRLGADDTVPVDPTGLDAVGQQSSAYDLGLIGRAVLRNPVLAGIVGSAHSAFTGSSGQQVPLTNHNKLLTTYPGAIGLKTGFTSEAGATYVGAARRGGHTILIVLLHARENLWPEVHALLDWGFTADAVGNSHPVLALAEPRPIPAPVARPVRTQVVAAPTRHPSRSGLPGTGTDIAVAITLLAVGYTLISERRRRRGTAPRREPLVISLRPARGTAQGPDQRPAQRRAWGRRRTSTDAAPTESAPTPVQEVRSEDATYPDEAPSETALTLPEGVDPFADTVELPAVRIPAGTGSSG